MSLDHVQQRWRLYRLLVRIMFANLNGRIDLNTPASPVPPFPKKASDWPDWALGVSFFVDLAIQRDITDHALRQAAGMLAAAHELAASIKVDGPATKTVNSVLQKLQIINDRVEQDGRFHAALEIGTALAAEVERRRNLA